MLKSTKDTQRPASTRMELLMRVVQKIATNPQFPLANQLFFTELKMAVFQLPEKSS
jgi:hypothetical protein